MPNLLPGISHAVIFFNTVQGSKTSGISAMMKLCFGSDENAISQIVYSTPKGSSTPVWSLPARNSGDVTYPIFNGALGEEILGAIGRAADRFKKANVPGVRAGRVFRVTTKGVEEIKKEAAPATAPTK